MKVKEESERVGLKLSIQKDKIIWSHHFMANRWGNNGSSERLLFFWAPKSLQIVTAAMKLRRLLLGRKVMTNIDSILKSRDITLPTKVRLAKAMVFSSSHVWMWELDCEESWEPKNWCFWTVGWRKLLRVIQPIHPKGDQSWVFIGRTDAKAETPILWPPHAKSWLIG